MKKAKDLNTNDKTPPPVSISNLEEYFDHDEEDIKSFTSIVLNDWTNIRADIQQAVATHDYQLLDDSTHKMLSVIRMLDAIRLDRAIAALKAALKNNTTEIAPIAIDFFSAMDEVIMLLKG